MLQHPKLAGYAKSGLRQIAKNMPGIAIRIETIAA
jgi:hypothetical protein